MFWWRGRLNIISSIKAGSILEFQSLFWWRGRLDNAGSIAIQGCEGFQSLFWWRGRLDILASALSHTLSRCFNPCFGGEAVWTRKNITDKNPKEEFQSLFWWRGRLDVGSGHRRGCHVGVSILVLVERPFGHQAPLMALIRWSGFNPCFGGEAVWISSPCTNSHTSL